MTTARAGGDAAAALSLSHPFAGMVSEHEAAAFTRVHHAGDFLAGVITFEPATARACRIRHEVGCLHPCGGAKLPLVTRAVAPLAGDNKPSHVARAPLQMPVGRNAIT